MTNVQHTHLDTLVATSLAAWENWNALGFEQRNRILTQWAAGQNEQIQKMVNFQCLNALEHVGQVELMPGPTGETNELYSAGRGCFVVTADESASEVAIIGQLVTALITGNTVLLSLPANAAVSGEALVASLTVAGCPLNTVLVLNDEEGQAAILHTSVAGVVYAGNSNTAQQFARQLAARDGLLAQLIAETDCTELPTIGSPTYSLRFITERTRTINITAVGGNATLLELGGGEEH
ncbi:proline dehydrogenase [Photobacterium jeanii]|uniref:Proline dehydrogenase n=1 Tax=Photobacterium jeanii TaxID=858640 RepID=A0A178K2J0_9GAMM|nr:aldehyde dehydrogenase family protein [Photobacterium jeanii]OAN10932.1 proline dehydrogenase [Photobacterium jeanii]PST90448.1 proline dehydrogenase [Photobacterium jeanii]